MSSESIKCPHCDCKVSLSEVEKEDGMCPECGQPISRMSRLFDDYNEDLGDDMDGSDFDYDENDDDFDYDENDFDDNDFEEEEEPDILEELNELDDLDDDDFDNPPASKPKRRKR